jgi:HNH endonuclease
MDHEKLARTRLVNEILRLVGPGVFNILELRNGWPSIVEMTTPSGVVPVALHVSNVSPHSRRPYEWRFQNPANSSPVIAPDGTVPILIGIDNTTLTPTLIAVDGSSRIGRSTRFSILFNHRIADEAHLSGWSEYVSGTSEHIFSFQPRLLPVFAEMIAKQVTINSIFISQATNASGLLQHDNEETATRARRMVSSLVRDARFSLDVRNAYEHKCALCGLKLGLVVGAHIYPVSAPGSSDSIWNGIAMCHNHHNAYDMHKIFVNADYTISINNDYVNSVEADSESRRFLQETNKIITLPAQLANRPRLSMLRARYDYYVDQYKWIRNSGL